ncbi:MFS transporter [Clavibacter michiganensis]|uniref:Inner membrane metabolite transport protein YhjE n=1 Tax=Clavibacter michiganensis TaxID=28447 RepID=A0A251YSQ0_9MICO|nr:MFS transporter [Clavibacter michiganensis]OUE27272.1 Inner membrane metabolite transport protein YhjE [Clavibacter michiganensis]
MTAAPTAAPPASAPANPRSRVLVASLVGTSIEFFDFYVYATAAVLVFPALFFANDDPAVAQLQSLAVFGVAFFARPIGSVVFGHFGDRFGRTRTLVASLLTMGVATVLVGCLPSGLTPGWEVAAPAALAVLRFVQGLGLGGEWGGAALLATENAPAGNRAVYGTFPQLGAPVGFILANGLFLVLSLTLSPADLQAWGWRVPFLASAVLVLVGLYVRVKLVEAPEFQAVLDRGATSRLPLGRTLRTGWRGLILGALALLATFTLFYLMTTFAVTYATSPRIAEAAEAAATTAGKPFDASAFHAGLGYARTDFLLMLLVGVVFFAAAIVVSGALAQRRGARPVVVASAVGMVVFGVLFDPLLAAGLPGTLMFVVLGFVLIGLAYGAVGSLLPGMFAADVRYTGASLAFSLAGIIGGAVAPFIATWLWDVGGGGVGLVGIYLSVASAISLVAFLVAREHDTADATSAGAVDATR